MNKGKETKTKHIEKNTKEKIKLKKLLYYHQDTHLPTLFQIV